MSRFVQTTVVPAFTCNSSGENAVCSMTTAAGSVEGGEVVVCPLVVDESGGSEDELVVVTMVVVVLLLVVGDAVPPHALVRSIAAAMTTADDNRHGAECFRRLASGNVIQIVVFKSTVKLSHRLGAIRVSD